MSHRSIEDINEDLRGCSNDVEEIQDYCVRNKWFPIENDLIGGWAIGLADAPVSAHFYYIADFMNKFWAEFICLMHNEELKRSEK